MLQYKKTPDSMPNPKEKEVLKETNTPLNTEAVANK